MFFSVHELNVKVLPNAEESGVAHNRLLCSRCTNSFHGFLPLDSVLCGPGGSDGVDAFAHRAELRRLMRRESEER